MAVIDENQDALNETIILIYHFMSALALRTEDIEEFENMKNNLKVHCLSEDLEENLNMLAIYICLKT